NSSDFVAALGCSRGKKYALIVKGHRRSSANHMVEQDPNLLYRIDRFTSSLRGRTFFSATCPQRKFSFINRSEIPPSFSFSSPPKAEILLLIEIDG
ncbi:hypothetical protein, partial [Streptococcus pseudopneumoniae]|uniref:hypothetical protein n=1 Tax=Streptococcus pseudopneumoniae TaxID=257758 RepID=UPI001BB1B599